MLRGLRARDAAAEAAVVAAAVAVLLAVPLVVAPGPKAATEVEDSRTFTLVRMLSPLSLERARL